MEIVTNKGIVRGTEAENGVTVFKGIPYAAPPTGARRWAPPAPHPGWKTPLVVDRFGPACPQPEFALDDAEPVARMDEDCLYLNVWTTGMARSHKPVMVWIHGGAFQIGDGASKIYDGSALAQMGAVVVSFNYRLGFLGFFAHPALGASAPVNFGLLDQIAALEWVRDNIAAFGGDPGNVTIFGQSAGATSVLALFVSAKAKGLFHKGIAQSAYAMPEHPRASATALCTQVASQVWRLGDNPTLEQLRAVPEAMFKRKDIELPDGTKLPMPTLGPRPVIDGVVLDGKIRDLFLAGREHPAKLMIGSTSNEQSVLDAFHLDPAMLYDELEKQVGEKEINDLRHLYRKDAEVTEPDLESHARFGGLIMRDLLFTMHARWLATHHAKPARNSASYWYYFGYVPEALRAVQPRGVPHGGEIIFPFQSGDLAEHTAGKLTPNDRELAATVSAFWFTFARDGVPTCADSEIATWPHLTLASDVMLRIGDELATQTLFRKTRLDKFALWYPFIEQKFDEPPGAPPRSRRG